jgi:ribosomal protein L37AE/L43A
VPFDIRGTMIGIYIAMYLKSGNAVTTKRLKKLLISKKSSSTCNSCKRKTVSVDIRGTMKGFHIAEYLKSGNAVTIERLKKLQIRQKSLLILSAKNLHS